MTASAELAYGTKNNIVFPGTVAQATAARAKMATDITDRTNPQITAVTVAATAIVGGLGG
jgi:hypothetical protein